MARVLSTAVVLVLLAATAVAFAITEGAKIEKSPIYRTKVTKVFSPNCPMPCKTGSTTADVRFYLRKRERLDVWIVDAHRKRVTTLVSDRTFAPRKKLVFVWNGITESGELVPDGIYMPVVKLPHRTFELPNAIRLDTKPPTITVRRPQFPIISPDGDGHADVFRVHYRVDEPARGILLVRGKQVELTYRKPLAGTLVWNGMLGKPPRPVRPGRYVLAIAAQDAAGNVSKPVTFAIAQVRYVVLARDRVVVRPGGKFALRVSTDSPTVQWRLNRASGTKPRGTLHFRAPRKPGVYHLYVSAAGHAAKCAVVVA
ncbi:MAG: hypothetical protein ACRDM1_00560 [Gaiellaceae bacterium]